MLRAFHEDGTLPKKGEVFVFGSNMAGIHGAGAARAALTSYGAKWGVAEGLTGDSYAIPTKDETVVNTRAFADIKKSVQKFVQFTLDNPGLGFFVTRIGCGLAGLKNQEVAPLFRNAINCSFPDEWYRFLK